MKTAAFALVSCLYAASVLRVAAGVAAFANDAPRPSAASTVSVSPVDSANPAKGETPDQAKPRVEATKPRQEATRRAEPPHGRQCFNPAETREKIATHRLAEPFRALRAGRLQGEALRARLCRWKPDEFVYEIFVLRASGRIAHVYMNARNGQSVGALDDPDRN